MTTATYNLTIATESGSYFHTIAFRPMTDGMVRIVETMRGELMGNWMESNGRPKVVGLTEARAYYRDRRRMGYLAG